MITIEINIDVKKLDRSKLIMGRNMVQKNKIRVLIFLFVLIITLLNTGFYSRYFRRPLSQKSLDGYPKTTFTKHGIPGDPVNIILVANHSTITKDFLKAGWKIPDSITKQTSLKISIDCILGRPYPTAPVSNLYLYGRKQDLTFELPGTTARTRDHIRLWNTKDTFEGQEIWVGSATHDAGIEISHTDDVPTHHISSNVDQERNFIMSELKPYIRSEFLLPYAKPVQNAENGGGDHYHSDGKVAILLASLSLNKDNFQLSQLK